MDKATNADDGRAAAAINVEPQHDPSTGEIERPPSTTSTTTKESTTQQPSAQTDTRMATQQHDPSQQQSKASSPIPNAVASNNTKAARPRLRKGKWTIEEEEYTSRIIQYFSTGLLTLPDGATLRSYLAEKLNCDPMRITKKFTGACCLGRRAYHLRDRPRASPAEVEMASFELMHLEQRFRLRVEHEQTGLPLPPRHELLASQPPPTTTATTPIFTLQQQGASSINTANPWLQNQAIAPTPGQASLLPGLAGLLPNPNVPSAPGSIGAPNPSFLLGQLLLQQNSGERPSANGSSATAPLQILNNLVASYALSHALSQQQQQAGVSVLQPTTPNIAPSSASAPAAAAAAATTIKANSMAAAAATHKPPFTFSVPEIAPSMSVQSPPRPVLEPSSAQVQQYIQLQQVQQQQQQQPAHVVSKKEEHAQKLKAAFEEQQRALRLAYEKSLKEAQEQEEEEEEPPETKATTTKATNPTTKGASHTANPPIDTTASPAEQLQRSYEAHLASLQRAEQESSSKPSEQPRPEKQEPVPAKKEGASSSEKKTPDEEAGVILLGFLNSLRESYEDAIEAKEGADEKILHIIGTKNTVVKGEKSASGANNPQETPKAMTQVSSDSSNRISEGRDNTSNHAHSDIQVNHRRRTSDPITSLSHFQSSKRNKLKPASVTETSSSTSSQPTIEQSSSSQEDSKSDKTGHSSSDDSERDVSVSRRVSKGPPRKRLKNYHEPHEFTRENLMAHSKRMDMECEESEDVSSSDG